MGLRVPQSSWLGMTPQQQMLMANGVMPTGVPMPEDGTPMISPSMPTEEQQKALADLQAAQMQSFQNQQQGINDLSSFTNAQLEQPVQTDLTGLAALTDAWTGSKFAQSYKAPQSGQEKLSQVAALKQALNKERGNLTENEIALLKAKINALTTQSIFGQKQEAKAGEAGTKKTEQQTKDDEEARAKIKKEATPALGGNVKFTNALAKYIQTVDKYGDFESLSGSARDEIESAYSDALVAYKEFKNLGALAEADLALARYGIKPQTGVAGGSNKIFGGGREGLKKGAQSLIEQGKKDFDLDYDSFAAAYKGRDVEPVLSVFRKSYNDAHKAFSSSTKSAAKTDTAVASSQGSKKYVPGKTSEMFQGKKHTYMGGDPSSPGSWKAD